MTVSELYLALNERIPPSLSCEWDNDGLMCAPEPGRTVRRVLVTLDITDAAIEAAVSAHADVILSHHPLIFRGVRHLTPDNAVAGRCIALCRAGIAAMSFHTRLDAVRGGVNDALADILGLADCTALDGEAALGRIGSLPAPLTGEELARHVCARLGTPGVLLSDAGCSIRRVAVVGGEGGDFIDAAKQAGADAYISGRLGYHPMVDAPENALTLIEAGHFFTEQPVSSVLCRMVGEIDRTIAIDPLFSNRIRLVSSAEPSGNGAAQP